MTRVLLALALAGLLAGCVPARAPAQLAQTPGPVAVVTGTDYDAGAFRAAYPPGWRVITSPANASPFVIFVAPDSCALIVIAVDEPDVPPLRDCPDGLARVSVETVGTPPLYVAGSAPAPRWDTFGLTLEAVRASITPGGGA